MSVVKDQELEKLSIEEKYDLHDCHLSPDDGCSTCDEYQEYKDNEIRELNNK